MNANANKGAMSVEEFLHWASIGRSKFYELKNNGSLKVRKIGGKTVVTVSDATEWLNALPEAS